MNSKNFFFLIPGMIFLLSYCKPPAPASEEAIDPELEKQQVSEVIHNSICWAITKDTNLLYGCFVQDTTLFIFHPDSTSTVRDFKVIKHIAENVWLTDRFKATECRIKDLRIQLSQGGDVAWFSCFLDDIGEWDGKVSGWYNARWTGVLEKRDGKWLIMQMHFSFPVDRFKEEK